MSFKFGIDTLLEDQTRQKALASKRLALVANPASVTSQMQHSLDALISSGFPIAKAFGPQHGMRGDKQDNMIESDDYLDPFHGIPVVSLYGEHRRPTADMLADVDVVLFDLQDVGCRIYTYLTTLHYFLEQAASGGQQVIVLDRPNPAGREIDGLTLLPGQTSFVGVQQLPTRYGLTIGEIARWFVKKSGLDVDLEVVSMQGYDIYHEAWPTGRSWVNPSPNAASVNMTHCFPGTVLLEGTTLSEGRGTTIPLEVIGAPDFPAEQILEYLSDNQPEWIQGAPLRICHFEPTFHKHVGSLCKGIQIHTDSDLYEPERFKPYRLIAGCLKALRHIEPDYELWRHHEYEYELDRTPIDVINGGEGLRLWVDDPKLNFDVLEQQVERDLTAWASERQPFLVYQ